MSRLRHTAIVALILVGRCAAFQVEGEGTKDVNQPIEDVNQPIEDVSRGGCSEEEGCCRLSVKDWGGEEFEHSYNLFMTQPGEKDTSNDNTITIALPPSVSTYCDAETKEGYYCDYFLSKEFDPDAVHKSTEFTLVPVSGTKVTTDGTWRGYTHEQGQRMLDYEFQMEADGAQTDSINEDDPKCGTVNDAFPFEEACDTPVFKFMKYWPKGSTFASRSDLGEDAEFPLAAYPPGGLAPVREPTRNDDPEALARCCRAASGMTRYSGVVKLKADGSEVYAEDEEGGKQCVAIKKSRM